MLSDTDRVFLTEHVARLCCEMHLGDWRINVLAEPAEEGTYAEIHPTYGQRTATLNVCADFRDIDPVRANKALVHELLHCHAAGVQHHVQDESFRRLLGDAAYSMWRVGFDQHHENHIDAVALVLAPFLTSLTWPEVLDSEQSYKEGKPCA